MQKWKILVTPKEACECLTQLPDRIKEKVELIPTNGRIQDPSELKALLKNKDAVILDVEPIQEETLAHCKNLKVISRFGMGYDSIDLKAAKKFQVRVARTEGVSAQAVALHTLALLLSLTHHVVENDQILKRGLWNRQANLSIKQLTLGILGYGRIGSRVAKMAEALGFKILVFQRSSDMNAFLSQSDIISLHLPVTDQTESIISASILKKLLGKYLINTSRGKLIDEKALLCALESGQLKGYATDVFVDEPITGLSKKIAAHKNVICSPHVAAFDKETAIQTTLQALDNAIGCLSKTDQHVRSYIL